MNNISGNQPLLFTVGTMPVGTQQPGQPGVGAPAGQPGLSGDAAHLSSEAFQFEQPSNFLNPISQWSSQPPTQPEIGLNSGMGMVPGMQNQQAQNVDPQMLQKMQEMLEVMKQMLQESGMAPQEGAQQQIPQFNQPLGMNQQQPASAAPQQASQASAAPQQASPASAAPQQASPASAAPQQAEQAKEDPAVGQAQQKFNDADQKAKNLEHKVRDDQNKVKQAQDSLNQADKKVQAAGNKVKSADAKVKGAQDKLAQAQQQRAQQQQQAGDGQGQAPQADNSGVESAQNELKQAQEEQKAAQQEEQQAKQEQQKAKQALQQAQQQLQNDSNELEQALQELQQARQELQQAKEKANPEGGHEGAKAAEDTGGAHGAGGGAGEPQGAGQASETSGPPPTGEVTGDLKQWIDQAKQILAGMGYDVSKIRDEDIALIAQHESGGNPRAVNNWDSNAAKGTPSKGLMQTIDPTFNRWAAPGHKDIWNPVDNIVAAVRYAIDRYGSLDNVPGVKAVHNGGQYRGY